MSEGVRLRPFESSDLDGLAVLIAEHAHFERSTVQLGAQRRALGDALLGPAARASCVVVEGSDGLVGYATWSREFSTWRGAEYVHLDTLYLRAEQRGRGIGRQLLGLAAQAAGQAGLETLEWQTPEWNEAAQRFYRGLGARSSPKQRFLASATELAEACRNGRSAAAARTAGKGSTSPHAHTGASSLERRQLRFLGLESHADWRIKCYAISLDGGPIPQPGLLAARRVAREALPLPARGEGRPGIAFLTMHAGRDAFWARLDWWINMDMLQTRVWRADLGSPGELQALAADETLACVWELAVVEFECQAWRESVLARLTQPDFQGYLERGLDGPI